MGQFAFVSLGTKGVWANTLFANQALESRWGLCFYPQGKHKARYEKYREAWCLMASAKDLKKKREN